MLIINDIALQALINLRELRKEELNKFHKSITIDIPMNSCNFVKLAIPMLEKRNIYIYIYISHLIP